MLYFMVYSGLNGIFPQINSLLNLCPVNTIFIELLELEFNIADNNVSRACLCKSCCHDVKMLLGHR